MTDTARTVDLERLAAALREAGIDFDIYENSAGVSLAIPNGMEVWDDGDVDLSAFLSPDSAHWRALRIIDSFVHGGVQ